jgi:hypothetical protein
MTGFPLDIGIQTEERYGTCSVCGRTVRWWDDRNPWVPRWVHIQPWAVTGPHAHRAVVAIPSDTEHKDAS